MREVLSQKKVDALKADFPPEALGEDNSRGFKLTSIKAAFVLERLNEVFGIGGWWYDFEPFIEAKTEKKVEICTVVTLSVQMANGEPLQIKQAGGKQIVKNNVTDARKSAVTDGLTKCASVLGIGHKIFKGMSDAQPSTPEDKPQGQAAPPEQAPPTEAEVKASDEARLDFMTRLEKYYSENIHAIKNWYQTHKAKINAIKVEADRQAVKDKVAEIIKYHEDAARAADAEAKQPEQPEPYDGPGPS